MAHLGRLWAGRMYGTNTGNLFLDLSQVDPTIEGTLRVNDSVHGVAVYRVNGTFGDALRISGIPEQSPGHEAALGELTGEAQLTEEGTLRGKWSTSIGTGGTFELFPHDRAAAPRSKDTSAEIPEQLYARSVSLGAIRLYGSDVVQLIANLRQDFSSGRVVATFDRRGSQVTKYAEDFLEDPSLQDVAITNLKLQIQEPEAHGINKLVVIEIHASGANEVRVQGIRESWVVGKAEALAAYLKQHERTLVTTYRRFGLNLNSVIFIAMIILLPSVQSLRDRATFVVGVFLILQALLSVHTRLVPNASIRLGHAQPGVVERLWPTALSWFIAVSSSFVAAVLFYWLVQKSA